MLKTLLWLGWGALAGAGALATLFMTAFGDEPRTKRAVQRAITPVTVWIVGVVILGGIELIRRGEWWSVALAYIAALSPPVVLVALIAALMALDRPTSGREEG